MGHKKSEQLITSSFEDHLIKNDFPHIRYQYFDFHHVCKNQKYELINPTIIKLRDQNKNFRYFLFDMIDNKTLIT